MSELAPEQRDSVLRSDDVVRALSRYGQSPWVDESLQSARIARSDAPAMSDDVLNSGPGYEVAQLATHLPEEPQIAGLLTPAAVPVAARARRATRIIARIRCLSRPQLTEVLTTGRLLESLADCGQEGRIVGLLKELEPEHQAIFLSKGHAVYRIARAGLSSVLLRMIQRLEPYLLTTVLSGDGAVEGLVRAGQSDAVVALVRELSGDQQCAVLTSDRAAGWLAWKGNSASVFALLDTLGPAQRADVLESCGPPWTD